MRPPLAVISRLSLSLLLLVGMSCHRADNFRGLQLIGAVFPNTTCQFLVANDPMAAGSFDPAFPETDNYQLGLLIQNNLGSQVDVNPGWGTTTTSAEYHGLMLEAVEGCWFQGGIDGVPKLSTSGVGGLVDCANYPDTSATFAASGLVAAAGGQTVAVMKLLDQPHLKALFGPTFSAVDIPSIGTQVSTRPDENPDAVGLGQDFNDVLTYDFFPAEPGPIGSGRAAAWGANYPSTHEAQVIYQMRAVARTAGGRLLRSNWLTVPINVCPKCVVAMCGPLRQKYCARGPCPDGTPCLDNGSCDNLALQCGVAKMFSGAVPDLTTTNMCLPTQTIPKSTPPTCLAVGCNR